MMVEINPSWRDIILLDILLLIWMHFMYHSLVHQSPRSFKIIYINQYSFTEISIIVVYLVAVTSLLILNALSLKTYLQQSDPV